MTAEDAFNEVCYYTLAHRDPAFIHQHVVDAFAAQYADEQTKPMKLTFALIGLHCQMAPLFRRLTWRRRPLELHLRANPNTRQKVSNWGSATTSATFGAGLVRLGVRGRMSADAALAQR